MLLVARIDVLCDSLRLGHEKVLTIFICLKGLNSERRLFKAIIEHNFLVLFAKLCSLLLSALTVRVASHHLQERSLRHLTDVIISEIVVKIFLWSDIAIKQRSSSSSSSRSTRSY